MTPPLVFIFAGPSATGKTTSEKKFIDSIPFLDRFVIDTTREKRDGEVDGVDYNFVSTETERDYFYKIEITKNWWYAYSLQEFEKYSPKIISVIEIKKAQEIKEEILKKIPEARVLLIGFTHPQEKRVSLLQERGETEEGIKVRLQREEDLSVFNLCDLTVDVISNKDDFKKIESLIQKEVIIHENNIFNNYQRYLIPTP